MHRRISSCRLSADSSTGTDGPNQLPPHMPPDRSSRTHVFTHPPLDRRKYYLAKKGRRLKPIFTHAGPGARMLSSTWAMSRKGQETQRVGRTRHSNKGSERGRRRWGLNIPTRKLRTRERKSTPKCPARFCAFPWV